MGYLKATKQFGPLKKRWNTM